MKKRFLVCLLTAAVVTASALAVTGCDNNEEVQSGWGYDYNLQTAYAAAVEKGYGGTLEEFIESISGKDGKDGKGAYEIWVENGNEGTEEEFLAWLKGENGKSVYEIWLENGHEGTAEDFFEWLKADASVCQHSYSDLSVILQPTCTAGGVEAHTCENCGVAEYRFTQANGHGTDNLTEYYDTKDSVYHFAVCGDCNVIYRERHEYENHVCTKCETLEYVPPVSDPHYYNEHQIVYTNKTTGMIKRYKGFDFTTAKGNRVYAMAEGVVESISLSEEDGNIITIDHGNGLKTSYRFVEPVSVLKVGDNVCKGQVIATVAAAYGSEEADGPHLCFVVMLDGQSQNPTDYFDAVYKPLEYVPPVSDPHYFRGYGETYKSSYGMITTHYALDLTAEEGDSVYAMAEGVVTGISLNSNTGNIITIDYGNGLITRYRFAEPIEGLKEGDIVHRGEVIATVAAAYGFESADGPHLHFEAELNGEAQNPLLYFDAVYDEPVEEQ